MPLPTQKRPLFTPCLISSYGHTSFHGENRARGVVSYYTATRQFGLTGRSRSGVSSFPQLFSSLNERNATLISTGEFQRTNNRRREVVACCVTRQSFFTFIPLNITSPVEFINVLSSRLATGQPPISKDRVRSPCRRQPSRNRRRLMSWQRLDISMPLVTEQVSMFSNTRFM